MVFLSAAAALALSAQSAAAQNVSPSASVGGYEAKFIDVAGVKTRYYDVGQGEPILLIHGARPGGTSSANTWTPVFAGLSNRFRVLAPDRLGHGMTENLKGEYTPAAEMQHIYNFIKALGLEKFHIMGQSTGAYHAARDPAARRAPIPGHRSSPGSRIASASRYWRSTC